MKVGVLTFHRATNYGTMLQAYAMVTALKKLGVDAELIDYRPEYLERTMKIRKLKIGNSIKEIISVVANRLIFGSQLSEKIEHFELFMNQYMCCSSSVYYTPKELSSAIHEYDVLISGSDQLWNERITGEDMTYFLPFEHPNKISYGSSFGVSAISRERSVNIYPLLSKFSHITTREATAGNIIDQLFDSFGIKNGVKLHRVVDPTLLLNSEEWCELKPNNFNLPSAGYILTYYMIETPLLRKITRRLQRETGLPVVNLKPSKRQMLFKQGKNVMWAGPAEFIACYASAKYVVTNSFHGTAFAINFEIPFYVTPLPVSMAGEVNSRLIDILDWYKLSDRYIDSVEKIHSVSAMSMPGEHNAVLNTRRDESLLILSHMLQNQKCRNED